MLRSDRHPPPPSRRSAADSAQASIDEVLTHVERWRREQGEVLVVAVDGHGASGKTTIACGVAAAYEAALVHTDDFFRDQRLSASAAQLPLADYYDWGALRSLALAPLRLGRPAEFPRRHWEEPEAAGRRVVVEPRPIVVLEGVTAAGPALVDLVDRRVLVATPEPERLRRLHSRISDEEWDGDWLVAEQAYFDSLAPDTFDLTVPGMTAPAAAEKG
jgi:uridine kinase